ncbi:MAG: hypothetical protein HY981_04420 [Candidatus Magasanikbacteria bacterium]|nr:hypothetical protein [Candidatus Magasanikbacteria bacterium]
MFFAILFSSLKRKRYFLTALAAGFVMFGISYYLMIFNITGKSIYAYALMNGAWFTILSVVLTLLVSIFFGLYATVWLLRRDIIKQGKAATGTALGASGAFGGIVASGCPTCGAPLLALIGAPFALMSLPFKGLELKVISLIFLFASIYWLIENIYRQLYGACKITPQYNFNSFNLKS